MLSVSGVSHFPVLSGLITPAMMCFLKFQIKSPELRYEKQLILSLSKETTLDIFGK